MATPPPDWLPIPDPRADNGLTGIQHTIDHNALAAWLRYAVELAGDSGGAVQPGVVVSYDDDAKTVMVDAGDGPVEMLAATNNTALEPGDEAWWTVSAADGQPVVVGYRRITEAGEIVFSEHFPVDGSAASTPLLFSWVIDNTEISGGAGSPTRRDRGRRRWWRDTADIHGAGSDAVIAPVTGSAFAVFTPGSAGSTVYSDGYIYDLAEFDGRWWALTYTGDQLVLLEWDPAGSTWDVRLSASCTSRAFIAQNSRFVVTSTRLFFVGPPSTTTGPTASGSGWWYVPTGSSTPVLIGTGSLANGHRGNADVIYMRVGNGVRRVTDPATVSAIPGSNVSGSTSRIFPGYSDVSPAGDLCTVFLLWDSAIGDFRYAYRELRVNNTVYELVNVFEDGDEPTEERAGCTLIGGDVYAYGSVWAASVDEAYESSGLKMPCIWKLDTSDGMFGRVWTGTDYPDVSSTVTDLWVRDGAVGWAVGMSDGTWAGWPGDTPTSTGQWIFEVAQVDFP